MATLGDGRDQTFNFSIQTVPSREGPDKEVLLSCDDMTKIIMVRHKYICGFFTRKKVKRGWVGIQKDFHLFSQPAKMLPYFLYSH